MNIEITARNFTISNELKAFARSKIEKLLKYDKLISSSRIILLKESRAEKVELIIISKNKSYIAKCHSSAFKKTIIQAADKIKTQILRTKK